MRHYAMIIPCDIYGNSMANGQLAYVKSQGAGEKALLSVTSKCEHFQNISTTPFTNALNRNQDSVFVLYTINNPSKFYTAFHMREYCEWLYTNAQRVTGYVTPYIAGDTERTYENHSMMVSEGLSPIPSIGVRDCHEAVDWYLANHNTIMVHCDQSRDSLKWVDRLRTQGLSYGKTHTFITYQQKLDSVALAHFDVVMSSMWAMTTRRGQIIVNGAVVEIVNPDKKENIAHISKPMRELIEQSVQSAGYDIEKLRTCDITRAYYNLTMQSTLKLQQTHIVTEGLF